MNPTDIKELIARGLGSVRMALRAKLSRITAAKRVMLAQAKGVAGETFQDAEVFQHAGLRSIPLVGTEIIVIPLNGQSAHGVVIAAANGKLHVANMQEGETALFNEKEGHFIHLKNGRVIRMEADTIELVASTKVKLDTPLVEGTGNIFAGQNIGDQGGAITMAGMRSAYNSHNHPSGGQAAPQM